MTGGVMRVYFGAIWLLLLLGGWSAHAQQPISAGQSTLPAGWNFEIAPYLWFPTVASRPWLPATNQCVGWTWRHLFSLRYRRDGVSGRAKWAAVAVDRLCRCAIQRHHQQCDHQVDRLLRSVTDPLSRDLETDTG